MNEITYTEIVDNSIRVQRVAEKQFKLEILESCKKNISTNESQLFLFVLNNDSNNYFAELLTNDDFLTKINKGNKDIKIYWCEPNIINEERNLLSYEHYIQNDNYKPKKIWDRFSEIIFSDMIGLASDEYYPLFILLKMNKSDNIINITDSIILHLKSLESFDNINEFQEEFEKFVDNLNFIVNPNESLIVSSKLDFITRSMAGNSIICNRLFSEQHPELTFDNLSTFLDSLIDSINLSDLA